MRLIDAQPIEDALKYTEFDPGKKSPWLASEVEAYMHFMEIIQSAPTIFAKGSD